MSVKPAYQTLRSTLRREMNATRKAGAPQMMWPVTDVSRLTGLTVEEIEYTFRDHENHLKTYVLVYDPIARTIHWNS